MLATVRTILMLNIALMAIVAVKAASLVATGDLPAWYVLGIIGAAAGIAVVVVILLKMRNIAKPVSRVVTGPRPLPTADELRALRVLGIKDLRAAQVRYSDVLVPWKEAVAAVGSAVDGTPEHAEAKQKMAEIREDFYSARNTYHRMRDDIARLDRRIKDAEGRSAAHATA